MVVRTFHPLIFISMPEILRTSLNVDGVILNSAHTDYSQCIPGSGVASTVPSTGNPTPTTTVSDPVPPSTTSSGAALTGSQIRAVEAPVCHFYLQNDGATSALCC